MKRPLPSQVSGIPALLKLKTGLFAAPTGCGKTLSYLLPLFQHLKNEESDGTFRKEAAAGPRALILVPTHELVRQVYATAKALSHYASCVLRPLTRHSNIVQMQSIHWTFLSVHRGPFSRIKLKQEQVNKRVKVK